MQIDFNKIKLPPLKERIRFQSGKSLDNLKNSIKRLDQLQNIIVDENFVLIAGWRRYHAIKELKKELPNDKRWNEIKVEIRSGLSKLQKFDIELEENWRRQNLTPYEMTVVLTRRKKIYETLHPETVKGAELPKTGEYRLQSKAKRVSSIPETGIDKKSQNRILEPLLGIEPAERYTKNTAELLQTSETTVQNYIQVGTAIEEKKFDEKTLKEFKEGKKTFTSMQKELIEERKKKKALGLKFAQEAIAKENLEVVLEADDEVDSIFMGGVEVKPISVPIEIPNWCKDCKRGQRQTCPDCTKQLVLCNRGGILIVKSMDGEACKQYDD